MPRIKLTIAYTGTDFYGWQRQVSHTGGQEKPTIQGIIMAAIRDLCGKNIHVQGAGRTDAGVHAIAQIAHMDVPDTRKTVNWQRALNTRLPPAIRIISAEEVAQSFHAQKNAKSKIYRYLLWLDKNYTPPPLYPYVWSLGAIANIDEKNMLLAAKFLEGRHDFAALQNRGADIKNTVRTLFKVRLQKTSLKSLRIWHFEADGFLKQMVRNIMGLLICAGQGRLRPEDIPAILAKKDRKHVGVTAPACGLFLYKIKY